MSGCYGGRFALIMRGSSEVQLLSVDHVQGIGSEVIRVVSGAVAPAQLFPCVDAVFYVHHM